MRFSILILMLILPLVNQSKIVPIKDQYVVIFDNISGDKPLLHTAFGKHNTQELHVQKVDIVPV